MKKLLVLLGADLLYTQKVFFLNRQEFMRVQRVALLQEASVKTVLYKSFVESLAGRNWSL